VFFFLSTAEASENCLEVSGKIEAVAADAICLNFVSGQMNNDNVAS